MKKNLKLSCCLLPLFSWVPGVYADYKTDIGYADLMASQGASAPTGVNVSVTQIEASVGQITDSNKTIYPIYAPQQLSGKTYDLSTHPITPVTSDHASMVGALFYGNDSIAPAINNITVYEANDWLNSLGAFGIASLKHGGRIINSSWVGNTDPTINAGNFLRLVDQQVVNKDFIHVVGMANGPIDKPLLGSGYNIIGVGRTDGQHDYSSHVVDSVYVAGRETPSIVAPFSTTSEATPVVAAAAALLVESVNPNSNTTNIVSNAERSETIKAALMAGADRVTHNTSTSANITDYQSSGHETANGLDDRFGAGQLNVFNSFNIIAAGEQNSLQDGGGVIGLQGFDYDYAFGGASGSNKTASYTFAANADMNLAASLVWNIGVNSALETELHHLNLELFDTTIAKTSIAFSASAIDNTQNLWTHILNGHRYELLVSSAETSDFNWDYSLAWNMTPMAAPVPVPGAIYLFGSALFGMRLVRRQIAKVNAE